VHFHVDARGKFAAAAALQTLARYPITTWCAPPTALRLIGARILPRIVSRTCATASAQANR